MGRTPRCCLPVVEGKMNQDAYETWADAQYDQMKDDIAEKQWEAEDE